ncbi:MAG: hypothetical protein K0V04_14575 [Deltaproteobacteria bacterium]|nr:hypothetical protein [Deltaproteobacteria bacterium]
MLASGCGALDRLEDGGATVFVFATHHATPENGGFPSRGEHDMPRQFESDQGWGITLLEAYVTISSVTLIGCNGTERPLKMFWGPCPEDLRDEDLDTLTVAGNRVNDGDYCTLRIEYSPYQTPVIDDEDQETRHQTPTNDSVQGATIYLNGGARMDGDMESVPFELRSTASMIVDLDLSEIEDGRPLNVAHREDFPKELLISKTYDRFFDGIDFDAFDPAALEQALPGILRDQTRISAGTLVDLDDDEAAPSEDN